MTSKPAKTLLILCLSFLNLLVVACVPTMDPEPAAQNNPAGSGAAEVMTVLPRTTVTPTTYPPTPSPIPPSDAAPTNTRPTPTPAPSFPGMVFTTNAGLWQTGSNWQPRLLSDKLHAEVAPYGRHLLYTEAGDIWLETIETGERQNLTNTPNEVACCAQWWPSRTDVIFYGINPEMDEGSPVMLDLTNGTVKHLSHPEPGGKSFSAIAGSPDGNTVAFDMVGRSLWLYELSGDYRELNPADYGLPAQLQIERIGAPSWSPDGRYLAVVIAVVSEENGWQIALGIFDLEAGTFQMRHPYNNVGRGGWFPPPPWSADGRYLAFMTEDVNSEQAGLWIIDTQSDTEFHIPKATNPVWSPDKEYLTYKTAEGSILTYPPDFTYKLGIIIPTEATLKAWQLMQPNPLPTPVPSPPPKIAPTPTTPPTNELVGSECQTTFTAEPLEHPRPGGATHTLATTELDTILQTMGLNSLCVPSAFGNPYLGVDWAVPLANAGHRIRLEFTNFNGHLIYSTYDFSIGAEYLTYATPEDYELVQTGVRENLIHISGQSGFINVEATAYGGLQKTAVFPFADHYLVFVYNLPQTAVSTQLIPDLLWSPYPSAWAAELQQFDTLYSNIEFKQ